MAGLGIRRLQPAPLAPPDLPGRRSGRDRLPGPTRLADPRADPARSQRLLVRGRGVAAVGPKLARPQPLSLQLVQQRQQVAALVLVAGAELDRERLAAGVDYELETAAGLPRSVRATCSPP